jgi:flagellum-specific peptidoglycan hydrolase FlgJ/LysM repeat protein
MFNDLSQIKMSSAHYSIKLSFIHSLIFLKMGKSTMKQQRTFEPAHLYRAAFLMLTTQLMVSCGMFTKTPNPNANTKNVPAEYRTKPPSSGQMAMMNYVEKYKTIAMREMERTGVPASIKLAQGLLESNAGRSELASMSNNHFGIKCHSDWQGDRYFKEDDDKDPLTGQLIKSCFRKYGNPEESFMAHSEFLRDPRKVNRYGSLFMLNKTDYVGWANGLQRAGYATANDYAEKLIRIIEDYQLAQYDLGGTASSGSRPNDGFPYGGSGNNTNPSNPNANNNAGTANSGNNSWNPNAPNAGNNNGGQRPFDTEGSRNDTRYIRAMNGETLYEFAGKNGLNLSKLQEYNEELGEPNRPLPIGTLIYTQQKRNSYRGEQKVHVVRECETMFDISQKYGVKLSKLLSKNEMREGEQPAIGSVLLLRRGWFTSAEKPALRDTFGEWRRCQMLNNPNTGNPNAGQGQPTAGNRPSSGKVDFEIPMGGSGNNNGSNSGGFGDQPYFPPVGQPTNNNNQGWGNQGNNNQGNNNQGWGNQGNTTTTNPNNFPTYPDNPSTGSTTSGNYPSYPVDNTPTGGNSSTAGNDPYPSYPSYPTTTPTRPNTTPNRPPATTPTRPNTTTPTTTTPPRPINNPRPNTTSPTRPAGGQLHTVAAGETLWAISRKYGTTVDVLKQLNGLPDNTIKIGQQIRVK